MWQDNCIFFKRQIFHSGVFTAEANTAKTKLFLFFCQIVSPTPVLDTWTDFERFSVLIPLQYGVLCKPVLIYNSLVTKSFFSSSRVVRKSIARVLTVINQTQKENLRKFYKVSPVAFSITTLLYAQTQPPAWWRLSGSLVEDDICWADVLLMHLQLLTKRLRLNNLIA